MTGILSQIDDSIPIEDALTGDDPEMQVLARAFVAELPERISEFLNAELKRPGVDPKAVFYGSINLFLQCHASLFGAAFRGSNPDFLEGEIHMAVDCIWKASYVENKDGRIKRN